MTAIELLQSAQQHALAIRPQTGGFPVLAAVLHRAGVRSNEWTLPAAQSVYRTDAGPVVQMGYPVATGTLEIPAFDEEAVVAAIRGDRAGESTFPEFLAAVFQAGVIRYVVDFEKRVVSYYGVEGELYIEQYPDVAVDYPIS